MKLRNKVLLAIGAAWGILLGLTFISSWNFLIKSFIQLEQQQVHTNLYRVQETIDQISNALASFTADWAHWNDAKAYMLGSNDGFIASNLNMTAYTNSNINLLMYFDTAGKLKVGVAVDLANRKLVPFFDGINKYIYPGSTLIHRTDINKDTLGFIAIPSGIMFIAASAVTDGEKQPPIVGALVTARFFSTALLQQVASRTRENLKLFRPDMIAKNPILSKVFAQLIEHNGYVTQAINNEYISGYILLRDINSTPIGMIRTVEHRYIFKKGEEAINFFLMSFLVLGAALTLLLWWLLRILIIKRLEKLDYQIVEVSNSNRLDLRVDAAGGDELSSVASKVNTMLSTIRTSHEQLEQRVQERTKELAQTNVKLKQEITEREAVEKQLLSHKEDLNHLAHYDSLTNLPNRVLFKNILNKALPNAQRQKKKLAILFIDLDRFKNINDALGHDIGDLVLQELAKRFTAKLRSEDTLARLGGDEFILLLPDLEHQYSASAVAEKLLTAANAPIILNGQEFFLSASIGISIFPEDGSSLEALQKNADMAMYRAKKTGGDSFFYYTIEMNQYAHKLIELEANLRKAIINKEFVNYYQPILDLRTNQIVAAEALVRWQHPEMGIIPPAEFIPFAEETGLILAIGEWVMRQACSDNKTWQLQGLKPITVNVNLSAVQFRHQQLITGIKNILSETSLLPNYLELEITESAVMENVTVAIAKLAELRQMGIKIAVDDFGTGYSSISYLKKFPVDVLKIDQSFIKDIPDNKSDMAIIIAIIELAHSLNLKAIAEGVATKEQLNFLSEAGCDYIQGYFLSQPVSAEQFFILLNKVAR